ncbi:putative reverse transcriptase domain-containing protein [Tanacetum coccineum]|uniref:Reverse transcriptase domain-containing protein n=1 Tax=Tanacetum coccineum TaxID=301880 RepID=A0ABQ5HS54_9ASTR
MAQSLNSLDTPHLRKKRRKKEEEEEEEKEESEKKRSKEASKIGSNSESSGYAASDNEVESDLESTARSEPKCKEMKDTPPRFRKRAVKLFIGMTWDRVQGVLLEEFLSKYRNGELGDNFRNHNYGLCANQRSILIVFHELAILSHTCTPESNRTKSAILTTVILTDEAVRCGTLTSSEKKNEVEETSKQRESGPCRLYFNCQKPGHFARYCRAPVKQVAPISAVRMENNQRVCYECGSSDHLRNTCPKLNRAPGQAGNRLALEGNRNTRNNGNQARGRAFSVNAVDALQDPNVVTGTFSLNDHIDTVLFDFGADFSFIFTKFAPLLNVKPSIVSPGYVIEVANGKKEEVDRIIRDCKLELGNFLFTIDLLPLGHGSFDMIVGMDWLSKNKAEIVYHEKVVRIPLEGGEILRVQGEHTLGGTKILMRTKANKPELSDIPIIRDFTDVFSEDFLGLPQQ